ncbi:hypothetical protein GF366_03610 [Candidatus Peregrinibacteria bacterium]|nr:hypothetical protein [Candidatus Peregrinibacteria bacterium]
MFENKTPQTGTYPKTGIEATFFGKVMTFFALAILASAAGTFITYNYFIEVFIQNPSLIYLFFIAELAIIFTARKWREKRPLNRIMFAAFAFITGITLAPLIGVLINTPGGVAILTKALLATGLTFTGTALIGWTTKVNLSGLRGFLMMGLLGMIIVGIIGIFVPWGNTFELVFSGAGVLLFCGFTMYDFQKIKEFPEDGYIDAALMLYLDIFNLFLFLLRFITALSRE